MKRLWIAAVAAGWAWAAQAGMGIVWSTCGWFVEAGGDADAGPGVAENNTVTWQLLYAGANNVPDAIAPSAAGWTGGDDVLLAERIVPAGGGSAADGTSWDSLLMQQGGNTTYEDPTWPADRGGFVFQRVFQGAPSEGTPYAESGLFAFDPAFAGNGAPPDLFYFPADGYGLVLDRAVTPPTPVPYLDPVNHTTNTCADYTLYTGQTTLDSGWYVVAGDITNDTRIAVSGDVHIILADGCTLSTGGVKAAPGGSLTIWGQTEGTGTLIADGRATYNPGIECTDASVTVNGGTVNATGGQGAAGIGGSSLGAGGPVTITGGTVVAKAGGYDSSGGDPAQAIGRGQGSADSGDLIIPGMKVYASEDAAEPVAAGDRMDTCRSPWAKLAVCAPHAVASCQWCGMKSFLVRKLFDGEHHGTNTYSTVELTVYSEAAKSTDAHGSCLTYVIEGGGIDCTDNVDENGQHAKLNGVYGIEQANHSMAVFNDAGWAYIKADLKENSTIRVTGTFGPYDPEYAAEAPNGMDKRKTLSTTGLLQGQTFYVIERDPGRFYGGPTGYVYTGDDEAADPRVDAGGMAATQALTMPILDETIPVPGESSIPEGALFLKGEAMGAPTTVFVVNITDENRFTDMAARVKEYDEPYDGQGHGLGVTMSGSEVDDYDWTGRYALGDSTGPTNAWSGVKPVFTNVCDVTVWVEAVLEGWSGTTSGVVRIRPAALAITAKNQTCDFDDRPHGEDRATYTDPAEIAARVEVSGLVPGDGLASVTLDGTRTAPGTEPIVPSDAVVTNATGDVTSNYDIGYTNGTLTVEVELRTIAASVLFNSGNGAVTYDGQGHAVDVAVSDPADGDPPVTVFFALGTSLGPTNTFSTSDPMFTNVCDVTVWVEISAEGYQTVTNHADVTILPATLAVTAKDQTYVFNGRPQGEDNSVYATPASIAEKVEVEGLAPGDVLAGITLDGLGTEVGTYPIAPSAAMVTNATGNVTFNYAIGYTNGTLTIEAAPAPAVTNVAATAGAPWDGKVTLTFGIENSAALACPSWNAPFLSIVATDHLTGSNYVADASALTGDTDAADGPHSVTWDMDAQGINLASSNVTFTVAYLRMPDYCVIDLSGGSNATSYAVSYLDAEPDGGFNTDEYKTTKLAMRLLAPGTFQMGVDGSGPDNPPHTVTLTQPFYCAVFETTQRQWELVKGGNPSRYKGDTRPVEYVSWNMICSDSDNFLGTLRSKTGLATLDLPTEAQWEYACRAGTTNRWCFGDSEDNAGDNMWYYDNSAVDSVRQTHAVGAKRPNAWGLYDMHGNVWEWCLDWYGSLSDDAVDPVGPDVGEYGSGRVLRGGSWGINASYCTSSYRYDDSPSSGLSDYGFRLVRTLSDNLESERSAEAAAGAERAGTVCAGTSESTTIGLVSFAEGDVVLTPYEAEYDGIAHTIGVETNAIEGLALRYASGALGESALPGWTSAKPEFTDVTNMTVYVEASAPGYFTATNSAAVAITPKPVTVTARSETFAYDGHTHSNALFDVAGLVGNDAVSAVVTGAITFPRESPVTNMVAGYGFTSGTPGNYSVTTRNGELTMTNAHVAVTITAADGRWTYDGAAHAASAVAVTDGSLLSGDELVAAATGCVTNVADTADGNNPVAPGYKVLHGAEDVTASYAITPAAGTLAIDRRPVAFAGASETRAYTGSAITITNVVADGLVAGHAHNVAFSATGTEVGGPYAGTITAAGDVSVTDAGGADRTGNYDIAVANGALTIERDPDLAFEVSLEGGTFAYDGEAHALTNAATSTARSGETAFEYAKDGASWTNDLSALTATNVADSCAILVRATNPNYANPATNSAALAITPRDVALAHVEDIPTQFYEGDPLTPAPSVTDGDPPIITAEDYSVFWSSNAVPGTGYAILTGRRNYGGTNAVPFTIVLANRELRVAAGRWGHAEAVVGGERNLIAGGTATNLPVAYGTEVAVTAVPDAGFAVAGEGSFACDSFTNAAEAAFAFRPDPVDATLRWKYSSAVGRYFAQIAIPARAGYAEALDGLAFLFADRTNAAGEVYAQLWDAAARAPQGVLVTDGGAAYRGVALNEADFAGRADGTRVLWGVSDGTLADTRLVVPTDERLIGLYVRKRVSPVSGNETAGEVENFLGYLTWKTDDTRYFLPIVENAANGAVTTHSSLVTRHSSLVSRRAYAPATLGLSATLGLGAEAVSAEAPTARIAAFAVAADGSVSGRVEAVAGGEASSSFGPAATVRILSAVSPAGPWAEEASTAVDPATGAFALPAGAVDADGRFFKAEIRTREVLE